VFDIGPDTSSDVGWLVMRDFAQYSEHRRRNEDVAHENEDEA
jgi:hypothetical protein